MDYFGKMLYLNVEEMEKVDEDKYFTKYCFYSYKKFGDDMALLYKKRTGYMMCYTQDAKLIYDVPDYLIQKYNVDGGYSKQLAERFHNLQGKSYSQLSESDLKILLNYQSIEVFA